MRVLFAAPENAWGGILERYKARLPQFEWVSQNDYQIESLAGFDAVIPTMSRIDHTLLADAPQLKLIQQMGAGLEGVDLASARDQQIAVANVPTDISGNADSVAELGIYLMIGMARQAWAIPDHLQRGQLGGPLGSTLKGKTAGLIGFGGLGKALARRLHAMDMELIACKRRADDGLAEQYHLQWCLDMSALPDLLARSDYVILTLPDNAETHHLMNNERFALMKAGAKLVNLGRGGLVDPDALLAALHSGHLSGAGLDVFWEEPPPVDHPLFRENLLATPHIGGMTSLSLEGIFEQVCANLERLYRGETILHRQA